jgi:uncharacterized delta-60 repeat protein
MGRALRFEGLECRALLAVGDLDFTFGSNGIMVTEVPGGFVHEQGRNVAIQADGKIVVAGFDSDSPFGEATLNGDFVVARYTATGLLDPMFGVGGPDGDGVVTVDFAGGADGAFGLTIQPDGKIIAAGFAANGPVRDFALVRFNSDGSLDHTFGDGGKVTTDFGFATDTAQAAVVQPDGKIIAGGPVTNFTALFAASPKYTATDIGTLGGPSAEAYDINSSGQVVGVSALATGRGRHAYRTAAEAPVNSASDDLGTLGGASSFGRGINDLGHAVGFSEFDPTSTDRSLVHAFRTAPGFPINAATDDLGTLGGPTSAAFAVNNLGQVTGQSRIDNASLVEHAYLWTPGGTNGVATNPQMLDIGGLGGSFTESRDLNDATQVVGFSFLPGDLVRHAYFWQDSNHNGASDSDEMIDLGTLGGDNSAAHGINASGQVIGSSEITPGNNAARAFVVTPEDTNADGRADRWFRDNDSNGINDLMRDIGTLPGTLFGVANAINDAGWVVGFSGNDRLGEDPNRHAWVWNGTQMFDLNDIAAPGAGLAIREALSINGFNEIVGLGLPTGGNPRMDLRALRLRIAALDYGVARYNSDGSLDTSFGTGGRVAVDFNSFDDTIRNITLQPDGKIVAAGLISNPDGTTNIGLIRLESAGTLDATFGNGGQVSTDFGENQDEAANAIFVDPLGRIVVAGTAVRPNPVPALRQADFAVARYLGTGVLDATFDGDGRVFFDFVDTQPAPAGHDVAYAAALQQDGQIVVAGLAGIPAGPGMFNGDLGLVRFTTFGQVDTSFGSGGQTRTDIGGGGLNEAFDMVLERNGDIVVTGFAPFGAHQNPFEDNNNLVVARYEGTNVNLMVGGISEFPLPPSTDPQNDPATHPASLVVGPDNRIWMTDPFAFLPPGSTGTPLAGRLAAFDVATQKFTEFDLPLPPLQMASVQTLTSANGTATATTTTPHGLIAGSQVVIRGANQAEYNGAFFITVTGTDTFTYPITGTPTSPATGMNITASVEVLFTPHAITVGPDGNLWFTAFTPPIPGPHLDMIGAFNPVFAFDNNPATEPFLGWTPIGLVPNPILTPAARKYPHIPIADPRPGSRFIYFSEMGSPFDRHAHAPGRMARFNVDTRAYEPFADLPIGSNPHGMNIGPDNNFWVALRGTDRVGRFDLDTNSFDKFVQLPAGSGPNDVRFSPFDNTFYVALQDSQQIGSFTYDVTTDMTGPAMTREAFTPPHEGVVVGNVIVGPEGRSIWYVGTLEVPLTDVDIQSLTSAGATATATTATPHGFTTGDQVVIRGADQAAYNGAFFIVGTGSTTFTYQITGTPASTATGDITASAGVPDVPPEERIVRLNLDPDGNGLPDTQPVVTEFKTGLMPTVDPIEIIVGPDGNIWFTESNPGWLPPPATNPNPGKLGRLVPLRAEPFGNSAGSPNGSILFGELITSAFQPPQVDIFVSNPDGTGPTNLTNFPGNDVWGAWSPDGTKIAFTSDRDGNFEIYVMNADGTNQTRLTDHSGYDYQPSWSPDGTKLAFTRIIDTGPAINSDVWVMDLAVVVDPLIDPNMDGQFENEFDPFRAHLDVVSMQQVTSDPGDDLEPTWSPDGSKIVFTSDRDGDFDVFVMNADGMDQLNLTADSPFADTEADWSPDLDPVTPGYQGKFVFTSNRAGGTLDPNGSLRPGPTSGEIFTMNIDGTGVTRLTFDPGTDLGPAWSPDGSRIVFTGVPFGMSGFDEIFVMDADGANRTRLTVNTTGDFLADWQPLSGSPSLPLPANFDFAFVPPAGPPPVVASFSAAAVEEGMGQGQGSVIFPVFLRNGSDLQIPQESKQIVTVSFLTNDAVPELAASFATATPVQDYIPRSGLLIFRPGETMQVPASLPMPTTRNLGVAVPLISDGPGETNEVFTTVFFLPTNAFVAETIPDTIRPGTPAFGKITNQVLVAPPADPPVIREFELSTHTNDSDSFAHGGGMTVAPDGSFWLSAQFNNKLTRFVYDPITQTGSSIDFPLDNIPGLPGSEYAAMGLIGVFPHFLTIGSDGNLWGTGLNDVIFRVNLQSFNPAVPLNVTYFRNGITAGSTPHGILEDPLAPGIFWFAEESEEIFPEPGGGNKSHVGQSRIARLDSATGQITEFLGGLDHGARLHGFGFDRTASQELWVGLEGPDQIARFDRTTMRFTDFVQFPRGTGPHALYRGPLGDNRLYVVLQDSNQIGVFNPQTKQVEEIISIPGLRVDIPSGMDAGVGDGPSIVQFVAGPDGGLWFTEFLNDRVGRLDLVTHEVTEYSQGITPNAAPLNIVVGPDGNLWFSEPMLDRMQRGRIAQIQIADQVGDRLKVELEVSATPFGPEITQRTGNTFWVNAYVDDLRSVPQGVVGGAFDLLFNTQNVTPTGMRQFGSDFTLFQQGTAEDANGSINETGALTPIANVGATTRAAFVAWEFQVTGNPTGSVAFTPEPGEGTGTITPAEFALVGQATPVSWDDVEFVGAMLDLSTTIRGDFNGDQMVNQVDLNLLIAHMFAPNGVPGNPGYEAQYDLTGDGPVNQFDLAMFIPLRTVTSTFSVTSVADAGDGSLRQAILDANLNPGKDTIEFDLPGSGSLSIMLQSALPSIADSMILDATTQSGYVGTPVIEINGALAGAAADGLRIAAGDSTVRGLAINQFSGAGIVLESGGNNIIQGNFIGTDPSGMVGRGNGLQGILIDDSPSNLIGGTSAADRNLVADNGQTGIEISGSMSIGNTVQGNYVGTNITGTAPLGNGQDDVQGNNSGVQITTAFGNVIGGSVPGARNLISGNVGNGVEVFQGAAQNHILGNYIGTDVSGTLALANAGGGMVLGGANNNTVGGTNLGAGNVISGNNGVGLIISFNGAGNRVLGNLIGTDITGSVDLGNQGDGILIANAPGNVIGGTSLGARNVISGNAGNGISLLAAPPPFDGPLGFTENNRIEGNIIGAGRDGVSPLGNDENGIFTAFFGAMGNRNNIIGGKEPDAGNLIVFNDGSGIAMGPGVVGNAVFANSIFSNGALGIDLGLNGPTSNDAGDADSGPNGLQNFPVLTSASVFDADATAISIVEGLGFITVQGNFSGNANTEYRIEFFANSQVDPSGFGEGKTFLGVQTVTTDDAGHARIYATFPPLAPVGQFVIASATAPDGSTSEFSAPITMDSLRVPNIGLRPILVPTPVSQVTTVITGPDGNVYFTEQLTNKIGRLNMALINDTDPNNDISEFQIPTTLPPSAFNPTGSTRPIAQAFDENGNLWFAELFGNAIGKFDLATQMITEFPLTVPNSQPGGMTLGPDGNIWFNENTTNRIGFFDPDVIDPANPAAAIRYLQIPTSVPPTAPPPVGDNPSGSSQPRFIRPGPDGNIWFTEFAANKVGRINLSLLADGNPSNDISEFNVPFNPDVTAHAEARLIGKPGVPTSNILGSSQPRGLAAGPDGNMWFTEFANNKIGRLNLALLSDGDPNNDISEFEIPTPDSVPFGIVAGPDGNLWFTEHVPGKIGIINTSGEFLAEIPLPSTVGPSDIQPGPGGTMVLAGGAANRVFLIQNPNAGAPQATTQPVSILPPSERTGVTVYSAGFTGHVGGLALDPAGENFYFSEQFDNRIGRFNIETQEVEEFTVAPGTLPHSTKVGPNIRGTADPEGAIWWSGLNGGFVVFDLATKTIEPLGFPLGPPPAVNSQLHDYVFTADGNMWFTEQGASVIGTLNLVRNDPNFLNFEEFPITFAPGVDTSFIDLADEHGLRPHNIIVAPSEIFGPNKLFVALEDADAIAVWDTQTHQVTHLFDVDLDDGVPDRAPHDMEVAPGPGGAPYLYYTQLTGHRLGRLNMTTGEVVEFPTLAPPAPPGSSTDFVMEVRPDAPSMFHLIHHEETNSIWFALQQQSRVARFDIATGTMTEYSMGIPPGRGPLVLREGPDGEIWASTVSLVPSMAGGLIRIDPERAEAAIHPTLIGAPAGSEPRIRVLDPTTGREWLSFLAFDSTVTSGVTAMLEDRTMDGRPEIIATSNGNTRVFDLATGMQITVPPPPPHEDLRDEALLAVLAEDPVETAVDDLLAEELAGLSDTAVADLAF